MARVIHVDGQQDILHPQNGRRFTLDEMQTLVGGYIEFLGLTPKTLMVVNEDGLPRGLPENPLASKLTGRRIVGDVLICKRKEV